MIDALTLEWKDLPRIHNTGTPDLIESLAVVWPPQGKVSKNRSACPILAKWSFIDIKGAVMTRSGEILASVSAAYISAS